MELIDARPGMAVLRVQGETASDDFRNEAGGHRWQRVPPTERSGRVHTSTVTVAVLPEPLQGVAEIRERDLLWETKRGTGPGGQHRNMTESAVVVRHKPTGLMAQCQSERSQHRNKASALAVLRARLWEHERSQRDGDRADARRQQVGSGMRGDKRRTIRVRDGQVHDHVTGQRWILAQYMSGDW